MSDSSPTDYGAELAGGVFEVASQFINQKIVEAIRKNFSGDGKRQQGDFYMDQSRELLRTHFQEIKCNDKQHILRLFKRIKGVQLKMDDANVSGVQRFFKTIDYKRLSKSTYEVVVAASNRGLNRNAMRRMADDIVDPQDEVESVLSEFDTGGLSQMDVEAYQSEATGERAVLFGFHRQYASTEHLLATSSFTYGSTDTVNTQA